MTVAAGGDGGLTQALVRCAEGAFRLGANQARTGNRVSDIGRAVEHETRRCGFHVDAGNYAGAGMARLFTSRPFIPNYHDPRFRARLTEGLVITVEPIIAAGNASENVPATAGRFAPPIAVFRRITNTPW